MKTCLTIWTLIFALFQLNAQQAESVSYPADYANLEMKQVPAPAAASGGKYCSCELFELKSRDQRTRTIALFAESSSDKKQDLRFMHWLIMKEKTFLRDVFAESLNKIGEKRSSTDCMSFYATLVSEYQDLQIYNILHADVYRQVVRR